MLRVVFGEVAHSVRVKICSSLQHDLERAELGETWFLNLYVLCYLPQ